MIRTVPLRRVLMALYLIASIATLLYTIGAPTEIAGG
jgi:hypothetical protein